MLGHRRESGAVCAAEPPPDSAAGGRGSRSLLAADLEINFSLRRRSSGDQDARLVALHRARTQQTTLFSDRHVQSKSSDRGRADRVVVGSPPLAGSIWTARAAAIGVAVAEVERLPEGRNTFLEASYVEKIRAVERRGRPRPRVAADLEPARSGFMTSGAHQTAVVGAAGRRGPEATDHRRNLPAQAAMEVGQRGSPTPPTWSRPTTRCRPSSQTFWRTRRPLPPNEEPVAAAVGLPARDDRAVQLLHHPLELAFAAESHPAVDWGIDAFFWIDLALNFRTTYFDEDGELVTDVWAITRRYLRGWFALGPRGDAPIRGAGAPARRGPAR